MTAAGLAGPALDSWLGLPDFESVLAQTSSRGGLVTADMGSMVALYLQFVNHGLNDHE